MSEFGAPEIYKNDVWTPESLYAGWLAVSILVMTVSLLFYHMTRVKSLEMEPKTAGIFSVILIIISFVFNISALVTYWDRIGASIRNEQRVSQERKKQLSNESHYRIMYLVLGTIYSFVQLWICVVITIGTLKS